MKPGDLVIGKPHRVHGFKVTPQVGILLGVIREWSCLVNHGKWDEHNEERRLWSVLTPGGIVEELEIRMEVVSRGTIEKIQIQLDMTV